MCQLLLDCLQRTGMQHRDENCMAAFIGLEVCREWSCVSACIFHLYLWYAMCFGARQGHANAQVSEGMLLDTR